MHALRTKSNRPNRPLVSATGPSHDGAIGRRNARRRLAFKIIVPLTVILLTLIAAEIALQVRWEYLKRRGLEDWDASLAIHTRSDDPVLIYELLPGSACRRDGVHIAINSQGFRDDEFPRHVPARAKRIVVIGDSVAWGWGVEMAQVFPQRLEERLRQQSAPRQPPPIVYNLAVDGYTTEQEIRLLETRGLALDPDLIIVSYVMNDPVDSGGGLARYYVGPRFELVGVLRKVLWNLTHKRPKEFHQYVHARHKKRVDAQFARLGQITNENDVPILIAVIPVFDFDADGAYPWQDLHQRIGALSESNGLWFLDLYQVFANHPVEDVALDEWHPTAKGHEMIAEALQDFINSQGRIGWRSN